MGQPVSVRLVPEVPYYGRNSFVEANGQPPVPPARSSLNKTAIMEAEIRDEKESHLIGWEKYILN